MIGTIKLSTTEAFKAYGYDGMKGKTGDITPSANGKISSRMVRSDSEGSSRGLDPVMSDGDSTKLHATREVQHFPLAGMKLVGADLNKVGGNLVIQIYDTHLAIDRDWCSIDHLVYQRARV